MNTPIVDTNRDWYSYYNAVANRPPRKTTLTALGSFPQSGMAIDLGCGDGRDTVPMLNQNWQVLAIDREREAINRLLSRTDCEKQLLTTKIASFEDLQLPSDIDLINASFCLPFCSSHAFPQLWQKITASLKVDGRFAGHFFGDRDSWCARAYMNCLTKQQVKNLFTNYEIELWEEEEHFGKTPLEEDRYWHIFHVVARKNRF